ncbi:MAG: hypothetical protein WEA99_00750 [Brumimicrobium sp.]
MTYNGGVKTISFVSTWRSAEEFNDLKTIAKLHFPDFKNTQYIFLVENKKEFEELPRIANVTYIIKKDFNLFGKFKKQEIRTLLIDNPTDILLCSDLSANKFVKKLIFHAKNKIKIGFETESLPNFDIAFRMEQPSIQKLFEQTEKYLKKLQQ